MRIRRSERFDHRAQWQIEEEERRPMPMIVHGYPVFGGGHGYPYHGPSIPVRAPQVESMMPIPERMTLADVFGFFCRKESAR